ncbi:hypothetical protein H6G64_32365 [Calothrix sp. FACHB-156]|nr:hypothetical protein [Calothrix sp. FACHB-156]
MTEQKKILKFSVPTVRYESTAIYENSQEQQFLVRVSGCNQSEVEQYTKNLSFFCETYSSESEDLLADEILITNEDIIANISTKTLELVNDKVEKEPEEIKVFIEVTNLAEEKTLRKFQFEFANEIPQLDQTLQKDEQIVFNPSNQAFIITKSSGTVKAKITVFQGSATFTLWEAPNRNSSEAQWRQVDSKFISVSANTPGKGELSTPVRANKAFKIKVQGQIGTKYTIKGDWDVN